MSVVVREFNIGPLVAKLKRILPAAMEVLPELIQEQARLMVSSTGNIPGMVQILPPAHNGVTGAAAGRHGEKKVASDIGRVYWTPSRAYDAIRDASGQGTADAFYAAVKGRTVTVKGGRTRKLKGSPQEAERILHAAVPKSHQASVAPFDGGALHRENRDTRTGRVSPRLQPRLVVLDPSALKTYIRSKQKHVGTLASSFNAAGQALGARGIPSFVSRHGTEFSSFQVITTANSFWVVMTPGVNFGGDEINRRWSYIIGYRTKHLDSRGYLTRIQKVFLEHRTDSLRVPVAA